MVSELQKEITKKLTENGAAKVGFCRIPSQVQLPFPELPYAVSIAVKLPDAVLKTIEDRPSIMYFQQYRTANARLDQLAFDAATLIERAGGQAFPIAASQSTADDKESFRGVFPHKTAAVASGLGFIGRSGLLINPEHGAKLRFATVLTDIPFEAEAEIIENGCGECMACRDACPAKAITGALYVPGASRDTVFDAAKCSANMKTYKDVGRGAVCGICLRVCPYSKL